MAFFLTDLVANRAALTPARVALHALDTDRLVSFRELDARVGRAAGTLAECGVTHGDRIAVLCRNRIEAFELLFACARLGAIFVPLNWRMPAAELAPLIGDARPKVLFHGVEDADAARALSHPVAVSLDATTPDGYAARCDAAAPVSGRTRWPGDETWSLIYTSGTTGRPKGVIQTYAMALVNAVNIGQAMGIRDGDVTLNFLPMFHTAGINLLALPTLMAGGTVLLLPRCEVDRIVELLDAGRLDTFFGVPAAYREIAAHPRFDALDLSRVRSFGCGGAPCPDVLIERFAARDARVCNGMGMTETGPTVFLMDAASVEEKIGSVGKPQLLVDVRIVDETGHDVAPGGIGELWFRGPGITPGYWERPDATAAAFAAGGWLRSGDLARQDEDGYYYVVGRIKDMFISGGENVYPVEVENVLAAHPAVAEAEVVAVADEKWGEVGHAFLRLHAQAERPEADALRSFCRERLAAYKVPKRFVIVVGDFPRTATGKVQKHLLTEGDTA